MNVLNWALDHWSVILSVLAIALIIARELGWTKLVRVLTVAIEHGERLDPRGAKVVKGYVRTRGGKAVNRKLQKFVVEAERKVG